MANPHTIKTEGRITTQIQDDQGTHYTDVTYYMTIDMQSLVTQLASSALVSQTKPKRSTRLQEAVVLTIKEVDRKEL